MNRRMIFYTLGKMIKLEAAILVLPLIVSLIYKEPDALSFLITVLISLALGFLLTLVFKSKNKVIYAKEGFAIVALTWITISAVGALPFVISGSIPNYIDAFFETVSGFTTTGASIVKDVTALPHGILFWRSFTHWIGGMGVIVFIMAIVPSLTDRSIHILRAEMPGPIIGKLVPKAKDTAKILYLIYIVITALEFILLLLGGMPVFDSLIHSFGTAGTGGFGIKPNCLQDYSPYCKWVITIFMLIFGVNFNLYYFILLKRIKSVFKNCELWLYLALFVIASAVISFNIYSIYKTVSETVLQSSFQVASIITTTGYSTADFNQWPTLSKTVLLILMFFGGCAGSTAGGLKIQRVVMLYKSVKRELLKMLHPSSVSTVKLDGKSVDNPTLNSTNIYFAIYIGLLFIVFILISLENKFSIETNFSAAVSCFNNVGPGFGTVGPLGNYSAYSGFSKMVLSFAMLFGRLEIYPLLFTLIPSVWTKGRF